MSGPAKTVSPHIAFDDRGRPYVKGTRVRVSMLVACHKQRGMSADEIAEAFAPTLSKPEVYASLLYYYENQSEMDAEIAGDQKLVDDFFRDHPPALSREKLLKRRGGQ